MKKRLKFIVLILFGIIIVSISSGMVLLEFQYPDVGEAPEIKIEGSSAQIKRGKYLANNVAVCMDCHGKRDWGKFAGPVIPGTEGQGGEHFGEDFGFPGNFYSGNITPHGIGDWTDGEIYRLITTGVDKDGEPIFPVMPYKSYGYMASNDVKAIIAYIRTLPSVENDVPQSSSNFPMNFIMRTIPEAANPIEHPEKLNKMEYGKYLVRIGGCGDCHTPKEKGTPIPGKYLAGGFEFKLPRGGSVRSSNITPHKSGIGSWKESTFVQLFKMHEKTGARTVNPGEFQTIMPWKMYAGMKDSDLKAIYAYLQSIEAVNNEVVKFE